MILLSMVEKELKQFFRNKGSVIMLFIFPIALITCLGFSLKGIMSGDVNIFQGGKVLYSIENNSKYEHGFNNFKEEFQKETGTSFEEITKKEEAMDLVNKGEAISLITINESGYDYYRSEEGEPINSKIFRSIVEQTLTTYALVDTVLEVEPSSLQEVLIAEKAKYVEEGSIGRNSVSSFEYYTFAELALIILYISTTIAESVFAEGSLTTINRIRLSKANDLKLIISKAILGLIIGILQITEVYLFSTFILKVNWGENLPIMIAVLLALTVFASILGIVIGLLIKESKSINSALQTIIITICMAGGCYGPLVMLKQIPILSDVIKFSPVYWVNSAMVSLNTGVVNNYAITAISMCLGSTLALILGYVIIKKVNGGKSIA